MCRNIRTLANFEPAVTDDEVCAAALHFVRKLSGTTHPSRVNQLRSTSPWRRWSRQRAGRGSAARAGSGATGE